MKQMGRVVTGTLGFVLLWASLALSTPQLSSYNFLRDVAVDHQAGELLIQLKFRKPPTDFLGPEFFKKSIQMDFPSAYVNPSKRYFDTGDERVRQVYVSQLDPKRMRLRLILAPGTPSLAGQMVIEQEGRVLNIRIQQPNPEPSQAFSETPDELASLLARANKIQTSKSPQGAPAIKTKTSAGQKAQPAAPAFLFHDTLAPEIPGPVSSAKKINKTAPALSKSLSEALKKERPKEAAPSQPLQLKTHKAGILDFDTGLTEGKVDLFSASLKMVYTLVLVLGLMFLIFHLFKKFGLKNSVFGGEGKPIKVLSTGFLAPRKSIALVEVAGDVLVIGISNEQISLLGNVNDPEQIAQIKRDPAKKERPKKKMKERRAVPRPPEKEELREPAQQQKVDAYKKRLVKTKSTNPFGDYVKKFTESPEIKNKPGARNAGKRHKQLEEVPVFE